MSAEVRNKDSPSKPPRDVESTRQDIWKQLGDTGLKIGAIPLDTDATRVPVAEWENAKVISI